MSSDTERNLNAAKAVWESTASPGAPRDDGGPAFPFQIQRTVTTGMMSGIPTGHVEQFENAGLSILDYFAGQAMVARIAQGVYNPDVYEVREREKAETGRTGSEILARLSYLDAAAMLRERSKWR